MHRSFRRIPIKKAFLMQVCLLSQIFIVIFQVFLELRKKIFQESITLLRAQSEHSMNNTKLPKFYLYVKESFLYNFLISMIISIRFFWGMDKTMKTWRSSLWSEMENKSFPKLELIRKLHYFFFVFKCLYHKNVVYNACEAVCLKGKQIHSDFFVTY